MADTTKRHIGPDKVNGLQDSLPRPNIVRIEVLDGDARERYLKTYSASGNGNNIYTATNELRKRTLNAIFTGNRAKEKVFYGFLSPDADTTFNMTGNWENSNIGGNAFDMVKKVASAAGTVGKVVNAAINIGTGINDIANQALDLNSTATGASTMSDFKSISLQDFNVSCVWYIPEQEKLATRSIKLLYRMLYPRQISQDAVSKLVSDGAIATVNGITDNVKSLPSTLASAGGLDSLANVLTPDEPKDAESNNPPNKIIQFTGDVAGAGSKVMMGINNFFGSNTTINPMPVRVCIGQHIDIEPLVITSISTKFSRETFISETQGRHLPLFAYTTIGFKYWLNPAPNLEFVNLLGTELFGDSVVEVS